MKTKPDLRGHTAQQGAVSRAPQAARWAHKPRLARLRALLHAGEGGNALIEFAMVLPMMLILTTGILMFGIAMNNYLALTNAVSMNAGLTLDPCSVAAQSIIAASPGLNPSSLKFTYTFNGVGASGSSCPSQSVSSGAAGNLSSGSTVTVTATYPLNLSIYGTNYSASNAVLTATSTELVQ